MEQAFFPIRIRQHLPRIPANFDAQLEELSYRRHCMDAALHHDENAFKHRPLIPVDFGRGLNRTAGGRGATTDLSALSIKISPVKFAASSCCRIEGDRSPMILSTTAAYGIYPMEARVQEIIAQLNEVGCPAEDVCMLMAPSHPVAQAVRDAKFSPMTLHSDAPASELLQWLSRLGAVIIPGVAFFVGSRVFLRAVLAPCPATLSSASAERLMGLGFSPHQADRYADRLNHDGIMIFVCCSGEAQSQWIREVLRRSGADEACCLQEAVTPAYVEPPERAFHMTA